MLCVSTVISIWLLHKLWPFEIYQCAMIGRELKRNLTESMSEKDALQIGINDRRQISNSAIKVVKIEDYCARNRIGNKKKAPTLYCSIKQVEITELSSNVTAHHRK